MLAGQSMGQPRWNVPGWAHPFCLQGSNPLWLFGHLSRLTEGRGRRTPLARSFPPQQSPVFTCFVPPCQGERLSHAVGCAFAACLERKQKREKECGVTASFDASRTSFAREGSFRLPGPPAPTSRPSGARPPHNRKKGRRHRGIRVSWHPGLQAFVLWLPR